MKITEINLKEEGAKYYCEEALENFIVKNGDLVGENSGVDITCVFTIGTIMNIEFERVETVKNPYERIKKELYYSISGTCEIERYSDVEDAVDNKKFNGANYFNNENYAEYVAFKEKVLRKLDRFAWEHNKEVINWNNERKRKYFIYYNHSHKIFDVCSNTYIQEMNIYFSDREIAEKAIEEFKDDLIKLYTWNFNF